MENYRAQSYGGSSFGRKEEAMLRINIIETDDPLKLFPALNLSVPDHLKHLELENFGISEILTFAPESCPQLSRSQRLFLRRLQDVLLNRLDSSNRYELYARDLTETVISECQLDDGLDLYVKYSRLTLNVGSEKFTLLSDREGTKSEEIVWLLQESVFKFDIRYRRGDIHLILSMIAACQNNFAKRQGILRQKALYGIKVLGEEFFFYKIEFEEEYLKQIAEKLPTLDLNVHKYPPTGGLRISKQEDRRKLLCLLQSLREHALSSITL